MPDFYPGQPGGDYLARLNALSELIKQLENLDNYADDTAAATGGIIVGGLYRTGSILKIRVA